MIFIILILLTALLMEGIGSYISVVGLSSLFAGDHVILAMAIILDIAKISSVSFLYQYWDEIKLTMKSYLTAAVVVLMIITSAGAFGYLSGAFQKAIQPNYEVALRVESYKKEQEQLIAEKQQLTGEQAKFNQQLAQLPAEEINGRQRLIRSFKPEQDRIRARLNLVTKRTDELRTLVLKTESENIEKNVHAGPITYVSKAFDVSMEDASKWIILTIIIVFDPLAIMLVLAGNFLIKRRQDELGKNRALDDLKYFQEKRTESKTPEFVQQEPTIYEKEIVDPVTYQPIPQPIQEVVTPKVEEAVVAPKVEEAKPVEALPEVEPTLPPETMPIEVNKDAHFIEVPESSIANLKINYPQALFRPNKTPSSKRAFYEEL